MYGLSNEEKVKTDNFLDHISNGLGLDTQKVLLELNENLKFSTFINDKYSIGICDLFCYALIISKFNKEKDEIKKKYANVSRWANYIQNLKGISSICKKIGVWFSLPSSHFCLDLSKLDVKKKKKGDF